jgi:hypothetical protein
MAPRLTPSIKHLLTLRKPHALPSPPISQLNSLFAKTFQDARTRKAETGWLALTVSWLLAERYAVEGRTLIVSTDNNASVSQQAVCRWASLPLCYPVVPQ